MSLTLEKEDLHNKYLVQAENWDARFSNIADHIRSLRTHGRNAFAEQGFPTTRNEDWKYTRVKALVSKEYTFYGLGNELEALQESHIPKALLEFSPYKVIVVNGFINKQLSTFPSQKGFNVSSFLDSSVSGDFKGQLGKYIDLSVAPFVALNTGFLQDGVFIQADDNLSFSEPIHVIYINDNRHGAAFCNPRLLCVAGKNSNFKVIESYISLGDGGFCNSVVEVQAREGANVSLYKLQIEKESASQVSYTQVQQERSSNCSVHTITLSGGFVRNDLNYLLHDSGCETHMYGLYLVSGKQHVDNHTFVDHAKPHCYSNELYKGIIDQKGTAVFNGKILVRPDAQKTNAYQSNNNILLSDEGNIYTKPQLEIFADDVKCSHGATTGQMDAEAMFYLRSRGIGEDLARSMLVSGFANDVFDTIQLDTVKEYLKSAVEKVFNLPE